MDKLIGVNRMEQDIRRFALRSINRLAVLYSLGKISYLIADRLIKKELDMLNSLLK